ncbi:hypothetical protein ACMXYX_17995 (plasmid) [Neptuniibacter sp. QD72_48]|uniref:hypothetical protein n=1 Tax=Neptuniibacter sp. QD72_48 TaxID=3398214 RepID=UPI0039F47E4C
MKTQLEDQVINKLSDWIISNPSSRRISADTFIMAVKGENNSDELLEFIQEKTEIQKPFQIIVNGCVYDIKRVSRNQLPDAKPKEDGDLTGFPALFAYLFCAVMFIGMTAEFMKPKGYSVKDHGSFAVIHIDFSDEDYNRIFDIEGKVSRDELDRSYFNRFGGVDIDRYKTTIVHVNGLITDQLSMGKFDPKAISNALNSTLESVRESGWHSSLTGLVEVSPEEVHNIYVSTYLGCGTDWIKAKQFTCENYSWEQPHFKKSLEVAKLKSELMEGVPSVHEDWKLNEIAYLTYKMIKTSPAAERASIVSEIRLELIDKSKTN